MSTRKQHFVPQAYSCAWKTPIPDPKQAGKTNEQIYLYNKRDGSNPRNWDFEPRSTVSIGVQPRTYTIGYDEILLLLDISDVRDFFLEAIEKEINSRGIEAFYKHIPLNNKCQRRNYLHEISNWRYVYANDKLPYKTKTMSNVHHNIIDQSIENKLQKYEMDWPDVLAKLEDLVFNDAKQSTAYHFFDKIIEFAIMMCFRSPYFDLFGLLSCFKEISISVISESDMCCNEKEKYINTIDELNRVLWKKEIYTGLLGNEKSMFKMSKSFFEKYCSMVILVTDADNPFLSSDNPAFVNCDNAVNANRNGFIMSLSPRLLMIIGKGGSYDQMQRIDATPSDICYYNSRIIAHAQHKIISSKALA